MPSSGLTPGGQYLILVLNTNNAVTQTGAAQTSGIAALAVLPPGHEPNNNMANATPVVLTQGTFTATGLTLVPGDQDWFQLTTPFTGGTADVVTITRNVAEGSLDLLPGGRQRPGVTPGTAQIDDDDHAT